MEVIKVLLVDDDTDFGHLITSALISLGYEVRFQNSLLAIEEVIAQFLPHIVVLDVEIGIENGIDKAGDIMRRFPSIPVLFVSSHTEIALVAEGIAAGGVNYLKKPFDIKELDAYLRRFAKKEPSETIVFGNYLFDLKSSNLYFNHSLIKQLSPLERNALVLFWENRKGAVTYETISDRLWAKSPTEDSLPSIHNLISKLRKLLSRDSQVRLLNMQGVGYWLNVEGE